MAYLGVDIGGTFTDMVHLADDGNVCSTKVPSTPPNFELGFFAGIEKVAGLRGVSPMDLLSGCDLVLHGTTVATNALVELRGAKIGMLTSRGHRDTLPVMRAAGRAKGIPIEEMLHASQHNRPEPIVARERIVEVDERVDAAGRVVAPLDDALLDSAIDEVIAAGAEAIAICFLWSIVNNEHELRAKAAIQAKAPGMYVTCSHEASARLGEYERFAAAAINAFLGPETAGYLRRLKEGLVERGLDGRLLIMQASGGVAPDERAASLPVLTIGSGPSAGVAATALLASRRGDSDVIATDMGGTSFDVALISDGLPVRTQSTVVNQYEFYLPRTDIRSIGSGGGSIIWLDEASKTMRVGPKSAGASPGPVAYGRGGVEPTITDADLVLGYLDAEAFLGGDLVLDLEGARAALERVGAPMGYNAIEAALAARRIVEAQMAGLIRQMTVERGMDPRDFAVYAYGGAAGMHLEGYLRELGCQRGIVPLGTLSATWSAYGCATSDVVHVYDRAFQMSTPFDIGALTALFDELEQAARDELLSEGLAADHITVERAVEMKYPLQIHRVDVPIATGSIGDDLTTIAEAFAARYEQLYGKGSAFEGAGSEIVGCRVIGRGSLPQPVARMAESDASTAQAATLATWSTPEGPQELETAVVLADALIAGVVSDVSGPAIIRGATTTIVIPPGASASADGYGNVVVDAAQIGAGHQFGGKPGTA